IRGASIKPVTFKAPETGVHLTSGDLIPITGNPVEVIAGPTGKSAYQYAVEHGYEGTEDDFGEAQLPDEVSWGNVSDKPDIYAPATHQHDVNEVGGPREALNAKADVDQLVTVTRAAPGVFKSEEVVA